MKEKEVQAIKEIERWLQESEMQKQESLVSKGTTLEDCMVTDVAKLEACLITIGATIEACLVTEGAALEACLVDEGIVVNDNTSVTESSGTYLRNECSRPWNENRSSDHESTSSGNDANANIGPSYDSDTVTGMKEKQVQAIKEIENRLKEKETQKQSLVNEGAVLEACLVTEGAILEACLVNKGRALDDNLVIKETIDDSVTSSEQLDESNISQQPHATFPQLDLGVVVQTFIPTDDPIAYLHKAMAFMSTIMA
nr:hypothetical protein [Tanacetum cinerariifolium]